MLIALQLPIADGRRFLPDDTTRLKDPYWGPTAEQPPNFLRSMGAIRDRPTRGVDGWINEDIICDASRWLRFDPGISRTLTASTKKIAIHLPIFRRWISDGDFVTRLEIGWRVDLAKDPLHQPQSIQQFIDAFLAQPVFFRGGKESDGAVPLTRIPARVRSAYRRVTTSQKVSLDDIPPDSIRMGPMLLYLELQADERPDWLEADIVRSTPSSPGGWQIFQGTQSIRGVSLRFCFGRTLAARTKEIETTARNFRINLMRMHAESHGLDFLSHWQSTGVLTPSGGVQYDRVVARVEKLLTILRPDRGPSADNEGFRVARETLSQITGGRIDHVLADFANAFEEPSARILKTLKSLYPNNAPQITMNTNNSKITAGSGSKINVGQGAGITGNVITTFHNVESSAEFRDAIATLEKQIVDILPKIPARDAGRLQDKLDDLKKPDQERAWYSVTATGLKEAALALKDIAAPIAATAATIVGMFAGG